MRRMQPIRPSKPCSWTKARADTVVFIALATAAYVVPASANADPAESPIVEQQRTVDSTSETTRLFALVGMAIADAVRVSWETKATFFSWRPTTAIRLADTDGNPATAKDEAWTSRIRTVGGSPEYNSGTSMFAGAASAAIEGFYCHGTLNFSFQTDLASNGPRFYASSLEAAREAGRSRIFQGIHFQFSNDAGRRAGRGIGREIVTTKLQPVGGAAHAGSCG